LIQDRIGRIEGLGFKWVRNRSKFEERFAELDALKKAKHGHCNPSSTPSGRYKSLALDFEWSRHKSFEERLGELAGFKTNYGHCNPPNTPVSEC